MTQVYISSLISLGVPGDAQILAEQLTISQPEWADFSHQITTGTSGFSNLPTALYLVPAQIEGKWVVLF